MPTHAASAAEHFEFPPGALAGEPNPLTTFHHAPKSLAPGAVTQAWTSFLGPTHDSVSGETKLLKHWPKEGPALVWEVKKGSGYAAPAIAGDRLVVFHREADEEVVECLNAERGTRYWRFQYPSHYQDRFGYNNGPRASPVIAGGRVFTWGAGGQLHCLKLETGERCWARDLRKDFGLRQNFFGVGSTPLVAGDLLLVNVGAPEGPCVAAFETQTGKQVWGAGKGWGPSYASPIPALLHGQQRVLVFAGGESQPPTGGLLCLEPRKGAVDFEFPWRSRSYESVNATTPVVAGNGVFVSASYETGGALLEILPNFQHRVLWTTRELGSHFGAVVHRDGHLYGFDGRHDRGTELTCLELKSGKTVWRGSPTWEETLDGQGSQTPSTLDPGRGALLWADGAFLCLGERGHLLWLDLSPQGCKELARAWLFRAPETWTPPVLSRGLLYIAQNQRGMRDGSEPRLLCYDLRAPE